MIDGISLAASRRTRYDHDTGNANTFAWQCTPDKVGMGEKQEPCIPRPGCSTMGRGRVTGKHLYNLIVGLRGPFRAQQKLLDRILAPCVHQYRCFAIRPRLSLSAIF